MKLVITEKPSQAFTYAAVLGVKGKRDGYIEGKDYLFSWCLGHLIEMAPPEAYDKKYAVWRKDDLPIIPAKWKYVVSKEKQVQFNILSGLMNREDVTEVINACDAGREGELIFRDLYYLVGCVKPMKRLWLSSMEEDAIREGFQNLHDGAEYDGLYKAALCRVKADWLVGMNATRLFSVLYHRTLNVGRVISPTMAMLVQREADISAFQPQPFYTPVITCGNAEASGGRFENKADAEAVAAACGPTATVTKLERMERVKKAPALFDLTALQREANRRCGFTAQQTLDYLQALYEKKLCSYPRTDSRFLTNDMQDGVKVILLRAAELCGVTPPESYDPSTVCDSAKVTDHHAIIPTATAAGMGLDELPEGEAKILGLVCWGVLRALAGDCRYSETTMTLNSGGRDFTIKGKAVLDPGWTAYEKKEAERTVPDYNEGQTVEITASVHTCTTTAPSHYTEDMLLADMERAGSKDMPENTERKGIGTPATRAPVLEKLVEGDFVRRKSHLKQTRLIPTQTAVSLVSVLPEQLLSPKLTAEWESRLKMVERGELSEYTFMHEIEQMLRDLVYYAKPVPGGELLFPTGRPSVGKCPRCGANVSESRNKKGYFCERTDCSFALWKDSSYLKAKRITLTQDMAKELLAHGKAMVRGMYSDRSDSTYDAMLVLVDDGKRTSYRVSFDFK